nr:hypothetical protein [Anaplasma marginale]
MAYEEADSAGKEMLRGALAGRTADIETAHSYITSLNIVQKATKFAAEYVDAANRFLEPFPNSQCKSKLSALLNSALQRRF